MSYAGNISPVPELYIDMSDGTFSLEESEQGGFLSGIPADVPNINQNEEFTEATPLSPWEVRVYYRVSELLCWLVPSPTAIAKRELVIEYIKSIVSRCLGARMFAVGAMMSKTFLPDEVIQITPFLCKGQDENWFIRVNEALCTSATGANKVPGISVDKISFLPNEVKIITDLNGVTLDVSPNELAALYSSALFEDFNSLIGCENLFKRSIILVKAWLTYEAPKYLTDFFCDPAASKSVSLPLLSPAALNALMIWLFYSRGSRNGNSNSSLSSIQHPMEALGLFLSHFSTIEWDNVAIAACAILHAENFSSLTGDLPTSTFSRKIEILIESYRQRYISTVRASQKCREEIDEGGGAGLDCADGPEPFTLNDGPGGLDNDSMFQGHFSQSSNGNMMPPTWGPQQVLEQVDFAAPSPMYQRSCINILDPVQPLVNLCAKCDSRTMQMLELALKKGYEAYTKIQRTLNESSNKPSKEGEEEMEELSLLRSFFQNTFAMLTNPARNEDAFPCSPVQGPVQSGVPQSLTSAQVAQCLESVSVEELEYWLRHAELVLASKITADAVAYLIIHVIEQRGPQPIGEIGKLLQDATGNPNLSKVLKSQFRGLKRLIEGYPHLLRLGDDHSFNPHVHLVRNGNVPGGQRGQPSVQMQPADMRMGLDREGGRSPMPMPMPFNTGQPQMQSASVGRTSPMSARVINQGHNQPVSRPEAQRYRSPIHGGMPMVDDQSSAQYNQFHPISFQNQNMGGVQRQTRDSSPSSRDFHNNSRSQYVGNSDFMRQQQQQQQQQQQLQQQQLQQQLQQQQQQAAYGRGGKGQLWMPGSGPGDSGPSRTSVPDQRWDMLPAERRGFGFGGSNAVFNGQSSPLYSSPNLSPANSRPHSPSGGGRKAQQVQGQNSGQQMNFNSSPARRNSSNNVMGIQNKPPGVGVSMASGGGGGGGSGFSASPVYGNTMNSRVFGQQDGGLTVQRGGGLVQNIGGPQQQTPQSFMNLSRGSSPVSRRSQSPSPSSPQLASRQRGSSSPDIMNRGRLPDMGAAGGGYQHFGMGLGNVGGNHPNDSSGVLSGLSYGMTPDFLDNRSMSGLGMDGNDDDMQKNSVRHHNQQFQRGIDIDFSMFTLDGADLSSNGR